ncbi:MAG TPA: thioesterase domain-containing protein [Ktedonobacteraceae bacterium]|nr:thioesterase domain-containing protein [Ktedonobacteraceae bacterium]
MPDKPEQSEARRALLERYLRGDLPQAVKITGIITQPAKAEVTDHHERVTAIQTDGSKRPFFYLHGDWTNRAFYCFNLAHDLGPDQPFYALETYSFDGLPVPPRIEDIAAAHLKALRTVQPDGPYLLGGWCNGALIAYEMACQLHAEGQTVDLLVMLDPEPGAARVRLKATRGLITLLGGLLRLSKGKQLDWCLWVLHLYKYLRWPQWREKTTEHLATDKRGRARFGFALPRFDAIFPGTEFLRQYYPGMFRWRLVEYKPGLYPGKAAIIWNGEGDFLEFDRAEWFKLLKGQDIEVHVIPGSTHETLIAANLPALSGCLHACLSQDGASLV